MPFPTYKTLQPSASVKVVDHAAEPIDGAKVELISSSYPYRLEKFRIIARTNHEGEVHFANIKEWRVEMPLMIHGMEVFFWNWCVSKDGYKTVQTHYTSSDHFETNSIVTLAPGESKACPEALE